MDYEKAKSALSTLQEEKRVQQDRLQLSVQAKQQLDRTLRAQCKRTSSKGRFGL